MRSDAQSISASILVAEKREPEVPMREFTAEKRRTILRALLVAKEEDRRALPECIGRSDDRCLLCAKPSKGRFPACSNFQSVCANSSDGVGGDAVLSLHREAGE